MARKQRRSKQQHVINLLKRIVAFFFSHVGLCALVIGYALLGAVVFRAVEGPHEKFIQSQVLKARQKAVDTAWNTTFRVTDLDKSEWERVVYMQMNSQCMHAIRRGYDGKEYDSSQWSFTGAFLYSLTVITTIGYGNTTAKTYFGKTLTILFAIIGIPLMLLFLTNIGDVMAKIFRFLYARSIRLKYRIILWHKQLRAAKIRRANSLVAKLARRQQTYMNPIQQKFYEDGSIDSVSAFAAPANGGISSFTLGNSRHTDVHDLLEARAYLDQLEAKENIEAQLQRISVPLSLVLLTMLAYLVTGTIIFCLWEKWSFLDGFYFVFISLTTIGFGDKYPNTIGSDAETQEKLVITSVYLLFGMALLAMCFNLAQEEVVIKVAWMANKFRTRTR